MLQQQQASEENKTTRDPQKDAAPRFVKRFCCSATGVERKNVCKALVRRFLKMYCRDVPRYRGVMLAQCPDLSEAQVAEYETLLLDLREKERRAPGRQGKKDYTRVLDLVAEDRCLLAVLRDVLEELTSAQHEERRIREKNRRAYMDTYRDLYRGACEILACQPKSQHQSHNKVQAETQTQDQVGSK
ncbi:MAG: hypothetical protein P4N59_13055 [Negativicutes bacterium]|nr:hypothetical protein [Negativicutes bacterium]